MLYVKEFSLFLTSLSWFLVFLESDEQKEFHEQQVEESSSLWLQLQDLSSTLLIFLLKCQVINAFLACYAEELNDEEESVYCMLFLLFSFQFLSFTDKSHSMSLRTSHSRHLKNINCIFSDFSKFYLTNSWLIK